MTKNVGELVCPECLAEGKRIVFKRATGLGSHRRMHGVVGSAPSTLQVRRLKEQAGDTVLPHTGKVAQEAATSRIRIALQKVGAEGLKRTALGHLFPGRITNRAELVQAALNNLKAQGIIDTRSIPSTSGRAAEIWFMTSATPPATSPKPESLPLFEDQPEQPDAPVRVRLTGPVKDRLRTFLASNGTVTRHAITRRFASKDMPEIRSLLKRWAKNGTAIQGLAPANGPGAAAETWTLAGAAPATATAAKPSSVRDGKPELLQCELCDYTTRSPRWMSRHTKQVHEGMQTVTAITTLTNRGEIHHGNNGNNGNRKASPGLITLTAEELELERLVGFGAGQASTHARLLAAAENVPAHLFERRVAEYLSAYSVRQRMGHS